MLKKLCKMMSPILGIPQGSRNNSRRPRPFRPGIEGLEDRSVLATIFVNTFADSPLSLGGNKPLRAAILEANRTPGPDTIQLQAGTYQISPASANDTTGLLTGDFDVTDSVTIIGVGAATIIQGNTQGSRDRLFEVL